MNVARDIEAIREQVADIGRDALAGSNVLTAHRLLDELRRDLVVILADLAGWAGTHLDRDADPEARTVDGHVWEIKGGGAKGIVYDNTLVRSVLAARLADAVSTSVLDESTGELVPKPHAAVVAEVVDLTCALTGAAAPKFKGWRKGPAKTLGVNVDDYGEKTDEKTPFTVVWR